MTKQQLKQEIERSLSAYRRFILSVEADMAKDFRAKRHTKLTPMGTEAQIPQVVQEYVAGVIGPDNVELPVTAGNLLKSKVQAGTEDLQALGIEIGKLYTNHGLPVDMALDRLDMSKEQKLSVLDGVCQWLIEHRRNSGATEKSIDRQRTINRKMIEDFIKKGETEVY